MSSVKRYAFYVFYQMFQSSSRILSLTHFETITHVFLLYRAPIIHSARGRVAIFTEFTDASMSPKMMLA